MAVHLAHRMYFIPPDIYSELTQLVTNRYLSTSAAVDVCVSHGIYIYKQLAQEFQFRSFTSKQDQIGSPIDFRDLAADYEQEPVFVPLLLSVKTLDSLADMAIESRLPMEKILVCSIDAARIMLAVRESKAEFWLCDIQGTKINNLTFLAL